MPRRWQLVLVLAAAYAALLFLQVTECKAQPQRPAGVGKSVLEDLLAELEARRGQYQNVPRKDAQFLNLLIKLSRVKRALEIGTSNGYSAIWICSALEETGGELTTIEIDRKRVREAKENLNKAGLAHRVTFLEGDAHKIAPTLKGPFDFIFLDADKGNEMDYFNSLFPKLSQGGVLAVHNAIRSKEAMKTYLDTVANHAELDTVIVSLTMDDGFAVSYRKRE